MACLSPTGERLLCVGESSSQVRAAYTGAWGEVIRDEDRPTVRDFLASVLDGPILVGAVGTSDVSGGSHRARKWQSDVELARQSKKKIRTPSQSQSRKQRQRQSLK